MMLKVERTRHVELSDVKNMAYKVSELRLNVESPEFQSTALS